MKYIILVRQGQLLCRVAKAWGGGLGHSNATIVLEIICKEFII